LVRLLQFPGLLVDRLGRDEKAREGHGRNDGQFEPEVRDRAFIAEYVRKES
jgi:hypothetical protein